MVRSGLAGLLRPFLDRCFRTAMPDEDALPMREAFARRGRLLFYVGAALVLAMSALTAALAVASPAAGVLAGAGVVVIAGVPSSLFANSLACRNCGGPLVQRKDDSAAVIRDRLKVFASQTAPLVDFYRDRPTFSLINGLQHPDNVTADLLRAIESAKAAGRGAGTRNRARA